MKKKEFTEVQIIGALKAYEAGEKIAEICCRIGVTQGTFYNWRAKFGGMEVNEAKQLRELEMENARLKKLLADKPLGVEAMKGVLSKKL